MEAASAGIWKTHKSRKTKPKTS